MYAFYADESGFSKSNKYESEQPVLVTAGILIDFTKLRKAIESFDRILNYVNKKLTTPVSEIKFSEIRNKLPYRRDLPGHEERADLLEKIVLDFQNDINFKIIYCAIDNQEYYRIKKQFDLETTILKHPYLCGSYKMLCKLNNLQSSKKNNKGKTFVILDEQNWYQKDIEELIEVPFCYDGFSEIFDTSYFGKSQYSKIIQIADLVAGIFRYYLLRLKQGKTPDDDYWLKRLEGIILNLNKSIVNRECFRSTPLWNFYKKIELSL